MVVGTVFAVSSATAQTYNYLSRWGSAGTGNGQFNTPYGLATDSSGNVYVCDVANNRIQKFDATGTFILRFGNTITPATLRLNAPAAIAVDSTNGIVYVADTGSRRIQRYSMTTGNATATAPRWGAAGTGNGQFNVPSGIALDSSSNVYVADTGNNRVQKFDSIGGYLTKWGSAGTADGRFNTPTGIAVDSSGNVYVVDRGNNRIQKFSSTGTFIAKWGSAGSGNGQFNSPRHIAVDSAGNVYVADTGNNRIQKFTPAGVYLTQWGTAGTGNGQFSQPRGVTVASTGLVYVTDTGNNRVQRFGPLPTAPSDPGATTITTTSMTFTWVDNSSDESGFKVYVDAGAGPPVTLSTTTTANATTWEATGLQVNAQYAFQVAATNSNGDSAKTTNFQSWTRAATPLAPLVSNPGTTTLDVAVASGDGNPAITTYAIRNTDSGLYVQAGGTLGAAPVYQTSTAWGTRTVTGLDDQTTYNFVAIARNGASVSTTDGPAGSGTTLDATPPNVISLVPAPTGPTNADSVGFEVEFDEAVQNFNDASDVTIVHTGTSHSGLTIAGGPTIYTVTVNGIAGDGSFTLAVNTASDVEDLSANALVSSPTSAAVVIDNTAPNALAPVPSTTGPTNAPSVDFAVSFDEAVQNFDGAGDVNIVYSGTGSTGVSIVGGPLNYTVSVSGITGDGSITLAVNTASDVQDLAGNSLATSLVSPAVTIDQVGPQIVIGPPTPDTTAVGPVTFSITYTNAVSTSLDMSDIAVNVTDTVLGVVTLGGSGNAYTLTVSDITGDGTLSISIAAGTAVDAAGNLAPAAGPSALLTVDSVPALSLNLALPLVGLIAGLGTWKLRRRR